MNEDHGCPENLSQASRVLSRPDMPWRLATVTRPLVVPLFLQQTRTYAVPFHAYLSKCVLIKILRHTKFSLGKELCHRRGILGLMCPFACLDSQTIMTHRWLLRQFLMLTGVLVYSAGSTVACINALPLQLRASPGIDRILESPGYPSGYQNDLMCFWRITATEGYVVNLRSIYVDVEFVAGCDKDYISIHDGNFSSAMVLAEYCNDWCTPVVSSGRHMFVRFITDSNVTDDGFQLSYTAVPPPTTTTTTTQNTPSPAPDQNTAIPANVSNGDKNLEVVIIAAVAAVVCVFGVLLTVCYVTKLKKPSNRVSATQAAPPGGRTRAGRRVHEDFVEYDNSNLFLATALLPPYSSLPPPAYTAVISLSGREEQSAPTAPEAVADAAAPVGSNSDAPVLTAPEPVADAAAPAGSNSDASASSDVSDDVATSSAPPSDHMTQ